MININDTKDYIQQTCVYELTTAAITDIVDNYVLRHMRWKPTKSKKKSTLIKLDVCDLIYKKYSPTTFTRPSTSTYAYVRLIPTSKTECTTYKLSYNHKTHLPEGVIKSLVSKTLFKESNVLSWKILYTDIVVNAKRNYLKKKPTNYSLEIRLYQDTGKIAVLIEGRLAIYLGDVSSVLNAFKQLKNDLTYYYNKSVANEWFKEILTLMEFPDPDHYYVLRNNNIKNLDIPFFMKLSLYGNHNDSHDRVNLRRRIVYIAKHPKYSQGHKVKLINDAILSKINFPNSVRKVLLKYPLQSKKTLQKIHDKIAVVGIDRIRILLETYLDIIAVLNLKIKGTDFTTGNNYYPDLIIIYYLTELMTFGVSFKKILNVFKKHNSTSYHYLRDSLRIIQNMHDNEYDFFIPKLIDFEQFHNELALIQQDMYNIQNEKRKAELMKPFQSTFKPEKIDDFTIRPINNLYELIQIGRDMSHCVGSYISYVDSGEIEILVITQKTKEQEKYVVCVELRNPHSKDRPPTIVQAKLRCNNSLYQIPTLNDALIEWANTKKIQINTCDIQKLE